MTELPFIIENCQLGKLVKYCGPRFTSEKKEKNTGDIGLIIAINKEKNIVLIRWFGLFPYDFNKNAISHYCTKNIYTNLFITVIQQ